MREYLFKCPKCGQEAWEEAYRNPPVCVHDNKLGYRMVKQYIPTGKEEVAAIPVSREKDGND